jgi:transposase InsO family protein
MDVQQLPCIERGSGFEYKISIIHLAIRFKYSEIHREATTENIALAFQRALDALPPFWVWTDNAMNFTMKYTAHPDRKTAFTKALEGSGRFHALIAKGKPWRNGFIERSNRTVGWSKKGSTELLMKRGIFRSRQPAERVCKTLVF